LWLRHGGAHWLQQALCQTGWQAAVVRPAKAEQALKLMIMESLQRSDDTAIL